MQIHHLLQTLVEVPKLMFNLISIIHDQVATLLEAPRTTYR